MPKKITGSNIRGVLEAGIIYLTRSQYDSLSRKDPTKLYVIIKG